MNRHLDTDAVLDLGYAPRWLNRTLTRVVPSLGLLATAALRLIGGAA